MFKFLGRLWTFIRRLFSRKKKIVTIVVAEPMAGVVSSGLVLDNTLLGTNLAGVDGVVPYGLNHFDHFPQIVPVEVGLVGTNPQANQDFSILG